MTVKKLLITSLHFNLSLIWKVLSCNGCTKYYKHLGYQTGFLSRHPTPYMREQWDTFPSIKFFTGTYIRQRNSICSNDRRNSNASGVCGDCQRRSLAPLPWKLAIPVLAVLSSVVFGGVAKSFWNCRSGISSLENWLFASWMTTSRNKSSRPEARSCGSSRPQLTEPKDRTNVPAEEVSEMSGVQPSVLQEPLLPSLKYMCFRQVHKSPPPFFFYISWLQCPLVLPWCCLTPLI